MRILVIAQISRKLWNERNERDQVRKRLYEYSLTGWDILIIQALVEKGYTIKLAGDNKLRVVKKDDES